MWSTQVSSPILAAESDGGAEVRVAVGFLAAQDDGNTFFGSHLAVSSSLSLPLGQRLSVQPEALYAARDEGPAHPGTDVREMRVALKGVAELSDVHLKLQPYLIGGLGLRYLWDYRIGEG